MSNPLPVGGLVELIPYATLQNQIGISVFKYEVASNLDGATDQVILDTICDPAGIALGLNMKPLLTSAAIYYGASLQIVSAIRRPMVTNVASQGFGTSGSQPLPTQVSGLISVYANTATKRSRGRHYIPFPSTDDQPVGADGPNGAYVARLTTLAILLSLYQPWSIAYPGGMNPVVLQPVICNLKPKFPLPVLAEPIVNHVARNRWATQRRRGDYGRLNPVPF